MKRFAILVVCLLLTTTTQAQNKDAEMAQRDLIKIFELCKKTDDKALADYIVYRGDDEARRWKDTYKANNKEELASVAGMRYLIQSRYLGMGDYAFANFFQEEESEGVWNIWEVHFNGKPVFFAMLKIGDRFAIGDIDD